MGMAEICKKMGWLILSLSTASALQADISIDQLLENYRIESDLSKITRRDSAGVITLYTREDLEQMQARSLLDILKTVPMLGVTRSSNNLTLLYQPTIAHMSPSSIRLYINDHDMTSTSFGSAMLIWGDMPVEMIDHIEIYKGASSIEFGNEPGILIIRLYTKTAERDEGGKIKGWWGDRGSLEGSFYLAHTTKKNLKIFAYADNFDIKYKKYHDKYGTIKEDGNGGLLYGDIQYNNWRIETGRYRKDQDNFLGFFYNRDGNLDATHTYVHASRKIPEDYNIQISYDNIDYERTYEGGVPMILGEAHIKVNRYQTRFIDDIFNLSAEKIFKRGSNRIMIGAFYKYKSFKQRGHFKELDDTLLKSRYHSGLNLYSVYMEDRYDFSTQNALIASLKGDFYRYTGKVEDDFQWIGRAGYMQRWSKWYFKMFLTHTYLTPPFYKLYCDKNFPYRTNPQLKAPQIDMLESTIDYRYDIHTFRLVWGWQRSKDEIIYSHAPGPAYVNDGSSRYTAVTSFEYEGRLSLNHRLYASVFTGSNSEGDQSPEWGSIMRFYDRFGDIDLYNEVIWRSDYDYNITPASKKHIKRSFNYTVALTWHVNEDVSVAFKGENVFKSGYKQAYHRYQQTFPVNERKFWINLEYLF